MCFNLGSAWPCMAAAGRASVPDCLQVYSRLDGSGSMWSITHQPDIPGFFLVFF